MSTLHQTFLDIALILDDSSDKTLLKEKLSNSNYDFDALVKVGSSHLILPTLYCKLKEWSLLFCLPDDLVDYLEEITSINRNRNETILAEIKEISVLFQMEGITHSFLKGSALLAAGYYKDNGQRMIGDIDILVDKSHLTKAQSLLTKHDYKPSKVTFGDNYFEHKHLPRLIPKKGLSAVEIHRKLIHKSTKDQVNPIDYLHNSNAINGIYVGSDSDIFWHSALNFQINDYGYYYNFLGLRNAYDLLLLKKHLSHGEFDRLASKKYILSFNNKMSIYFESFESNLKNPISKLSLISFKNKQKCNVYRVICYKFLKTIDFIVIIVNRFKFFVINPSYRKDSWKDRKRIISIIKKRLTPYKT